MRYLTLCAAMGLLGGCAAYGERLRDSYSGLFKTKAQIEAEDIAKCEGYGAQRGTDIFVTCMVGLAQVRASNRAAAAASDAAANSVILQNGLGSASQSPFSSSTITLPNGGLAFCQSIGTQTTCN